MIFRRKREPGALTGARAILKAMHRDQITGEVHGHEWEITAWWRWTGTCAEQRRSELDRQIERLAGKCLPDEIAWAENLARHIAYEINTEFSAWGAGSHDCVLVEIARHDERLFARWPNPFPVTSPAAGR